MNRRSFSQTSRSCCTRRALPSWASAASRPDNHLILSRAGIVTDFDVIVVGGGPAGCTAAIAAAREGSKVLLIEATGALWRTRHVRNGAAGLRPFTDGEKVIYRGLAKHIFDLAKKGVPHEPADKYDWGDNQPRIPYECLRSGGNGVWSKILFFSRVAAVEMASDGIVDALIVANKSGLTGYKANVYIDASGDGDVCAWAGARFFKRRQRRDTAKIDTVLFRGERQYPGLSLGT